MVHAKYVARIGLIVTALVFGWALLGSPGVAVADTTSSSGATGSHAPRTGKAAPRPATARKAAARTVTAIPRAQARSAKAVPAAKSANSIVSDVTACACNLLKTVATYGALFVQELRPPTLPEPAPDPFGAWVALAWVRKQAEDAVQQIAALPVVRQVRQAITRVAEQAYDAIMSCGITPPTEPPAFVRTPIATGLSSPTDFAVLPDGRILITQKAGAIRIYQNGALSADPLLVLPTRTEGERGLLGIEVDPHFADNGFVYVAYTTTDAHYRLSRLTVTADGIDATSELQLFLSPDLEATNHQGGDLLFGSDGMLYWGVGDNTDGANAQDLTNIHGKILRLNPTDGSAPQDNPFYNTVGAEKRIWAYGLRNPFRLEFTPDGRLLAGDVGNNAVEELDLITKGGNYGWPGAEGVCASCTSINPIYTYDHSTGSAAITSVLYYTGDAFGPSFKNTVFIADYIRGWIKVLSFNTNFTALLGGVTFDGTAGSTVKLAEGPDGSIYQLTIFPGELSVLTPAQ